MIELVHPSASPSYLTNKRSTDPSCIFIKNGTFLIYVKYGVVKNKRQFVFGREDVSAPTISRTIQISNSEKKNDKNAQPIAVAMSIFRHSICNVYAQKIYPSQAAVIPKIISNTCHTSRSTTTRLVRKARPLFLFVGS